MCGRLEYSSLFRHSGAGVVAIKSPAPVLVTALTLVSEGSPVAKGPTTV